MIQNIFKNRITQEDTTTLNRLNRDVIKMNDNKETTTDTPDGLFMMTIQPNKDIFLNQLADDFKYVLCRYYHWYFGNGWYKKQDKQFKFFGIYEKQTGEHLHIHLIIKSYYIKDITIFYNYITSLFKVLHPASSFDIQRVYDIKKCIEYLNPDYNHCLKDIYMSKKRTEAPIAFTHTYFIKETSHMTQYIYDYLKGLIPFSRLMNTIFEIR